MKTVQDLFDSGNYSEVYVEWTRAIYEQVKLTVVDNVGNAKTVLAPTEESAVGQAVKVHSG